MSNAEQPNSSGALHQKYLIIKHLHDYGSITQKEAADLYGIMRLGARIWDLKRIGFVIGKKMERGVNRFGKPVQYARYYSEELQEGNNGQSERPD